MKRLWSKAWAAMLCYMALSPLYFLPAAALLPDRLWLAAVLPVPALLLTGWAALRPGKRRALMLLLVMVFMAAGCAALFLPARPLGLLMFLPCAVTMLLFMPAMARPAHQEWPVKHLFAGLLLHVAAQVLKGVAVLEPAAAPLSWIFVAYLVLFLFSYNRTILMDTGSASVKPLLIQNRILLAAFCLLALLLTNIRAVGAAIRTAIMWTITGVAYALTWLSSLFQSEEVATGGARTGNPLAGLAEEAEPTAMSRIVEIILIVLAILIAAVLLFFVFRQLFRLLRKLLRALMERLKLFKQRISADYVDQSETLMDWGEIKKTAAARLRRVRARLLPTPWEKLSPAQRVRRVYQLLLRRADTPDPALTAAEMLQSGALRLPNGAAAPAASLYDRARYSTHPVSPQEADALRRQAGV